MGGAENGFSKVIYNGNTGYALSSYLSPDAVVGNGTEKVYEVVNCQESITLRTSPSTSASEICQIPLGETVIDVYKRQPLWRVPYERERNASSDSFCGRTVAQRGGLGTVSQRVYIIWTVSG